jgi:hypothetical protein
MPAPAMRTEYKRNGTANLFVFLDVHRPWRKVKVTTSRTAVITRDVGVGGSIVYRTKRRFVLNNLEAALSEEPRPGKLQYQCFASKVRVLVTPPRSPAPIARPVSWSSVKNVSER